jgi:arylsulfatase A-like enzyme
MSMTMALESLRAFDPRVLMINLPACDYYGHRVGGPATPQVMEKIVRGCDRQLARLIKAYGDRGLLDETVFVVIGDHGMVPNTHRVDDTGLKQGIRKAGGDYLFHTPGNGAYIWLRNPSASSQVAQYLVNTIPHAPFAYFQTIESGVYTYHPVARTGTVITPELEAAHQYLLGTFSGALAPDIALIFEENTIMTSTSYAHGEHSGATWGSLQVPLVIAGPGVARGRQSTFPARLMDVAPTVLTLLGTQPIRMDGVVLADALVAPSGNQEAAQGAVASSLTAFQKAVMARSRIDIAAQKAGR